MAATDSASAPTGFEDVSFDLRSIPIGQIRLGKYSLRDVDRNGEEFQRLRDSIAASQGPYLPILVREVDDVENPGSIAFGLIDGLQRYSACLDLGIPIVPARVVNMEDAQVAAAQIIANRSRIETKPVEYTQQLRRMFMAEQTLTLEELADRLDCSVKWLQDRLSLTKLHPDLQTLVDDGKIPLAQAFVLAKLQPKEEQLDFIKKAQEQGIQQFSGEVANRTKALKEAMRAGRENVDKTWQPVPHIRPVKTLKEQLESPTIASEICAATGADTAEAGFHAALKWVFNLDPAQVEIDRQKNADEEKKAAEKKAKLAAERKEKKEKAERAALLGIPVEDLPADSAPVPVMAGAGGGDEDEDEDEDDDN